jgi:antitoxin StbD
MNMIKPNKPMKKIYADTSVSVADLKNNPTAVIEQAEGFPVAILNHNKPVAYLVPAPLFELLMDKLEEVELAAQVRQRGKERKIKVALDDL